MLSVHESVEIFIGGEVVAGHVDIEFGGHDRSTTPERGLHAAAAEKSSAPSPDLSNIFQVRKARSFCRS